LLASQKKFCQTWLIVLSKISNSYERGEKSLSFILRKGGIQMDRIPDLPGEEWRPIEGYGGKYLCSNMGRIKSLKHANARLLTPFMNNKGYDRVCLCQFGEAHHFLVSRLVA
jgi:hypothetical protein